MTGLSAEQLDVLVELVAGALGRPWQAAVGRPRELTLREARGFQRSSQHVLLIGR
jgi:hypothetical protein